MSLKLEVGEYYLSAKGTIIKINHKNKQGFYIDSFSFDYNQNGDANMSTSSENDLIAHIPKELHYDIIKTIKAYHTDDITKHYIDNAYNNKENN